MSDFIKFKDAINAQFTKMSEYSLFRTDVSKDDLWDKYLESFPAGSNPIYKERTVHDCQCCKQFIRAVGNVVALVDGSVVSIWDVEIHGEYGVVADAMGDFVTSSNINNVFLHYEEHAGTDHNHQDNDGEIKRWDHFHYKLPVKFVNKSNLDTVLGDKRSNKEVLKRSLDEITLDAAETVIELIYQKSIYRGEEHKSLVETFVRIKTEYEELDNIGEDVFCWEKSLVMGGASKIRNTVIGTLLSDISDGVDLTKAVKSFEAKVAPANYKRPTALITQSMINKAQEKVQELGIEASLSRRYAVEDDITINNVLYADKSVKKALGVFDDLSRDLSVDCKKFDQVDEVNIDTFIESIMPKADSLELMFDNKQVGNLMSLVAPVNPDSPSILNWDNNFSWSYNGEVTDSMKERVKSAGGNIVADLRFSIQWNESGNNNVDFDAHCKEPTGTHIFFSNKGRKHQSSGMLDVDVISPNGKIAVENITWTDFGKMPMGNYILYVNNYSSGQSREGFSAQIEFNNEIYDLSYNRLLRGNENIAVATVNNNGQSLSIVIAEGITSSKTQVQTWGINTQSFHKVSMIMQSPNHWDGQTKGNKHWFFMLDECVNDGVTRGFYNEFLKPDLIDHRKVFEVLGSKMKVEKSNDQLSGLGFSSTQKTSVLCRVKGSFNRVIKINF